MCYREGERELKVYVLVYMFVETNIRLSYNYH